MIVEITVVGFIIQKVCLCILDVGDIAINAFQVQKASRKRRLKQTLS